MSNKYCSYNIKGTLVRNFIFMFPSPLSNISTSNNGMNFFNDDSSTRTLRECVFMDQSDHICLTVWREMINQLEEGKWYKLSDINIKQYFDVKLSTTASTVIEELDKIDELSWDNVDIANYLKHEKADQKKSQRVFTSPTILNISIDMHPICTNELCKSKVDVVTGAKIVHCTKCSRKMLLKNCPYGFGGFMDIEENGIQTSIIIKAETLSEYFGLDVITTYQGNIEQLEEDLLLLEDVDFVCNNKNMLTNITKHKTQ